MTWVLTALLIGLALGAAAAASGSSRLVAAALAIEPAGTLWTNAIRMLVIPLIVSVVITSVARQRDLHRTGRVGGLAVLVFVSVLFAGGLFAALVVPYSFDHLTIRPRRGRETACRGSIDEPGHPGRPGDAVSAPARARFGACEPSQGSR